MDNRIELVTNAIGASGFTTDETSAGYIMPSYWNRQVLLFVEERLVVANQAKIYNDILGQDGTSFTVTVDDTPTAAAAVVETVDVVVTIQTHSQVIFTPTEYAKAYQLHDKVARRSFLDQMQNMSKKIGYAIALSRDDEAITLLTTSAGNTVVANGVDSSAVASSDTLDFTDIVNGATLIREDKLIPKALVISAGQLGQVSKLDEFKLVNQSGSGETLREGFVGRIYGMDVLWTTQITPASSKSKALILAEDGIGEQCFGVGQKSLPQIRTERHELGRYTDIVGVEERQYRVLRANGFCTIESWDA